MSGDFTTKHLPDWVRKFIFRLREQMAPIDLEQEVMVGYRDVPEMAEMVVTIEAVGMPEIAVQYVHHYGHQYNPQFGHGLMVSIAGACSEHRRLICKHPILKAEASEENENASLVFAVELAVGAVMGYILLSGAVRRVVYITGPYESNPTHN